MAALKPGGWVEAQEFDMAVQDDHDSFPDKSMIKIWHKEVERSFRKAGCEMRITGTQLKNYMEGAGFVNVHVQEYKWPMSPWPEDDRLKEAGAFAMLSMLEDIEAISLASLTGFGGWKKKEVDIFVESTKTEWKTKGPKGYWWLYVVYGQKPELPKRDVSEESEAAPTAVGNGNGQS